MNFNVRPSKLDLGVSSFFDDCVHDTICLVQPTPDGTTWSERANGSVGKASGTFQVVAKMSLQAALKTGRAFGHALTTHVAIASREIHDEPHHNVSAGAPRGVFFRQVRLDALPSTLPVASQKGIVTVDLTLGTTRVVIFDVLVRLTTMVALNVEVVGKPLEGHIADELDIGRAALGTVGNVVLCHTLATDQGTTRTGGRPTVPHDVMADEALKVAVLGHDDLYITAVRLATLY